MNEPLKKILIVDDEVKIIEVVKSFLESKGFMILSAENGGEALKVFENEQIALILLDLMLPDMTGEEICHQIRKKSRVPIIMLTAKVEESDLLRGLNIGADDYMTKPFSLKELYARIEAVLRRAGNDLVPLYNQMSFNNGDLEVDFESHNVRKNQKIINLTPNEYKILTALIQYPGKVFTRDELINRALGDGFDGYDRAVDSHIKNLRQKIETDPRKPVYIITIFGIGYKFGGE
jgi:DNA-binding response OmpR family regulator